MICDKKSEIANQLEDFLARKDKHKAYDAHKLRNSYAHLEHAHRVMGKLSKDVEKADQAVSKERQKLMVAHQETNIMEKMKDHEYSAFNEELNRQERKELDEIVSRCYNR